MFDLGFVIKLSITSLCLVKLATCRTGNSFPLYPLPFPDSVGRARHSLDHPGTPKQYDYDGWTIVKISGVNDAIQRAAEGEIEKMFLGLEDREDTVVLQEHRLEGFYHVAASPKAAQGLIDVFQHHGFTVTNLNVSLGEQIALSSLVNTRSTAAPGEFTTESYMNFRQIEEFIEKFTADNQPYVQKSVIGKTWENHNIYMLTITSPFRKPRHLVPGSRAARYLPLTREVGKKVDPATSTLNAWADVITWQSEAAHNRLSPQFSNELPKHPSSSDFNRKTELAQNNEKTRKPDEMEEEPSLLDDTYETIQNLFSYFRGRRSVQTETNETGDPAKERTSVEESEDPTSIVEKAVQKTNANTTVAARSTIVDKPVILIDGGIHAREWVSPASVMYMASEIVKDATLLDNIEWKLIPCLNPDGYIYSWTADRLWRKNRSCNQADRKKGGPCQTVSRGTDLNRNFGYKWGVSGSSGFSFSEIYRGEKEFSEPESQALRDTVLRVKDRLKGYVSVHSYGQMILHPWGYTDGDHPDHAKLEKMGQRMSDAMLQVHGERYTVGSAAQVLYSAAGGSDDWVSSLGVPYSYTFELRDQGATGFILPPHLIQPTVTETYFGIRALAEGIIEELSAEAGTHPRIKLDSSAKPNVYVDSGNGVSVSDNKKKQESSETLPEAVIRRVDNDESTTKASEPTPSSILAEEETTEQIAKLDFNDEIQLQSRDEVAASENETTTQSTEIDAIDSVGRQENSIEATTVLSGTDD